MPRAICTLAGTCELDRHGDQELADCQRTCRGVPSKDLLYLTAQYEPLLAMTWAPSDRQEVVYRLTGYHPTAEDSRYLLFFLSFHMYKQLLIWPELYEWLADRLPPGAVTDSGRLTAIQHFGTDDPSRALQNGDQSKPGSGSRELAKTLPSSSYVTGMPQEGSS
jgi:hypothetical protein